MASKEFPNVEPKDIGRVSRTLRVVWGAKKVIQTKKKDNGNWKVTGEK